MIGTHVISLLALVLLTIRANLLMMITETKCLPGFHECDECIIVVFVINVSQTVCCRMGCLKQKLINATANTSCGNWQNQMSCKSLIIQTHCDEGTNNV